jgi:hypothetical protein
MKPCTRAWLEVCVTFDSRRGYVASAPELKAPVVAVSLGGLRHKIANKAEPIGCLSPDSKRLFSKCGVEDAVVHRRGEPDNKGNKRYLRADRPE